MAKKVLYKQTKAVAKYGDTPQTLNKTITWLTKSQAVFDGDTGGGGTITVDTEMSDTSTNAVENKTIKSYVDAQHEELVKVTPTDIEQNTNNELVLMHDTTEITGQTKKVKVVNSVNGASGVVVLTGDDITKNGSDDMSLSDAIDNLEADVTEKFTTFVVANPDQTTDTLSAITINGINYSIVSKEVHVVNIDAPAAAVQGILTEDQLNMLQADDSNYIMFNHEKYYLGDKGHVEDYLTYSHVGYENNQMWLRSISITVSTRSWVLNSISVQSKIEVTVNEDNTIDLTIN